MIRNTLNDWNFWKGRHASTSRNRKFSTSMRAYSIYFPPAAISGPDGKFSFHGSRPKKHFYTHKSLNLLSVLWIQYIQWKADIQCQLKLNFFDPIQSIIQDYSLRKRHYLIYFSVLDFFSLFFEFRFLFSLDRTFSYQNRFLIFLYWKDFHVYFSQRLINKINLFVKTFLRVYNCWTSCYK